MYRDIDGYDPDQPVPDPPERTAPRKGSSRTWVVRAGVVLLIAGAVFRVSTLMAGDDSESESSSSVTSSAESTTEAEEEPVSPPPSEDASPTEAPTSSAPTADTRAPKVAAQKFMKEWAQPKRSPKAWHKAVSPLATDSFAAALRSVNPNNVPATKVTDMTAEEVTATSAEFIAKTDGPEIRVLVQRTETKWLVASVEPVTDAETEDEEEEV